MWVYVDTGLTMFNTVDYVCIQFGSRWDPTKHEFSSEIEIVGHSDNIKENKDILQILGVNKCGKHCV